MGAAGLHYDDARGKEGKGIVNKFHTFPGNAVKIFRRHTRKRYEILRTCYRRPFHRIVIAYLYIEPVLLALFKRSVKADIELSRISRRKGHYPQIAAEFKRRPSDHSFLPAAYADAADYPCAGYVCPFVRLKADLSGIEPCSRRGDDILVIIYPDLS